MPFGPALLTPASECVRTHYLYGMTSVANFLKLVHAAPRNLSIEPRTLGVHHLLWTVLLSASPQIPTKAPLVASPNMLVEHWGCSLHVY